MSDFHDWLRQGYADTPHEQADFGQRYYDEAAHMDENDSDMMVALLGIAALSKGDPCAFCYAPWVPYGEGQRRLDHLPTCRFVSALVVTGV